MSDDNITPTGTFPRALTDPSAQLEPHDWFRDQRTTGPVHYDAVRECYDVFDYETVRTALADHETFSVDGVAHGEATEESTNVLSESMLFQDPPRHTELRDTVDDFFTPGAIKEMAPDIEGLANDLVDTAVDGSNGQFDLVEAFAAPLPVTVIARILGIPEEDHGTFREWSMAAAQASSMDEGDGTVNRSEVMAAHESMREYFTELLAARSEEPGDDLLSRLVTAGNLSGDELFGFTNLLLIAGNLTTTSLIANAVWCFEEDDRFVDMRDDPDLLEHAIEEVLRYRSPVQVMQRWTTQQVVLGDHEVPPGSSIALWLGAANRDPDAFDDPDSFVPTRHPNRHVAFGHGIHTCLGASLARLEARIALGVLLERFDSLTPRLDELQPSGSVILYGPASLPIRYRTVS